jgi:hypothetical protein
MIKIKIFSSFCSNENCKEVFERINYSNEIDFYGINKKYYFTNDNNYTHAILLNTPMPALNIPKENVIGLAFEPIYFLNLSTKFIEYAKKHIGKYYIGDNFELPDLFIEHFGYMWHSRPPKEITQKNKNKLMSIIVSEKKSAPGHKYRHQIIEEIIKSNLPIDIYGRGSNQYTYSSVKGTFNDAEPFEDYLFSICIENYTSNHYFSEKIITPLMYNCVPIYAGCKNIDMYVENVIKLTGNVAEDIKLITDIIQKSETYYKKTYTEKNIKAVNLIQNLPNIFS